MTKLTKSSFALLEVGASYCTKSGDIWIVFRQMGGLFAARRESDDVVEYFYPSGRPSNGSSCRAGRMIACVHGLNPISSFSVSPSAPESGTVTVGGEPSTTVHVTIDEGIGA